MGIFKKLQGPCSVCGSMEEPFYKLADGALCESCWHRTSFALHNRKKKALSLGNHFSEKSFFYLSYKMKSEEFKNAARYLDEHSRTATSFQPAGKLWNGMLLVDEEKKLFTIDGEADPFLKEGNLPQQFPVLPLAEITDWYYDVMMRRDLTASTPTKICEGARAVLVMNDPVIEYLYLPLDAKNGILSNYKANLKKAAEPLMAELETLLGKKPLKPSETETD